MQVENVEPPMGKRAKPPLRVHGRLAHLQTATLFARWQEMQVQMHQVKVE